MPDTRETASVAFQSYSVEIKLKVVSDLHATSGGQPVLRADMTKSWYTFVKYAENDFGIIYMSYPFRPAILGYFDSGDAAGAVLDLNNVLVQSQEPNSWNEIRFISLPDRKFSA